MKKIEKESTVTLQCNLIQGWSDTPGSEWSEDVDQSKLDERVKELYKIHGGPKTALSAGYGLRISILTAG